MFDYKFVYNQLEFFTRNVVGNLKAIKKMFREILKSKFGKIPKWADVKVVKTLSHQPAFL